MIQEFTNYLRSIRGYSENTIRAYSADLRSFAQWAREHTDIAKWRDVTRDHLDMYITSQAERGIRPSTTNRQLSAISSLFRYAQRQGIECDNPCQYESRRKLAQTIPATLSPEQIARAYHKAKGNRKTMLGLLATTGIRIQEMLDLQFDDIDFENSTLHIKGKGSKDRLVSTDPRILETLKGLKEHSGAWGKIFYVSQRKARYMIYDTLAPYCQSKHLNPHTIRHTFATELAKAGENTAAIAKILGHSHIETSQKYINMAQITNRHTGIILN